MIPVLYSNYNCPHSLKAAFFLNEKGVEFRRVEVDLSNGEQKSDIYLAKNPRGTVPAYEDENGVIGDSLGIMLYIDARTPGPQLFPDEPETQGLALAWIERADQDFWDVSHHLYWQLISPPASGTNWNEVEQLRRKGVRLLQELENRLLDHLYVLGEFSIVDVVLLPWVYGYQRFDLPAKGQFPAVEHWRDTLSQRGTFTMNYRQKGTPLRTFVEEQQAAP